MTLKRISQSNEHSSYTYLEISDLIRIRISSLILQQFD